MDSKSTKIVLNILRVYGMFAFLYNHRLQLFTKSKSLQIYAVIHALFIGSLTPVVTYLWFLHVPPDLQLSVHYVFVISAVQMGCLSIVVEKLFFYDTFLDINNEIHRMYFGPLFRRSRHSYVSTGIVYILTVTLTTMPLIMFLFNLWTIVLQNLQLATNLSIIITTFMNMHVFTSVVPVFILFWILSNVVASLNLRIKTVVTQINSRKLNQHQMCALSKEVNAIAILYSEFVAIIYRIVKLFSWHVMSNLLLLLYNFVWCFHETVHYIVISSTSVKAVNWLEYFSYVFNIFFFFFLIVVIVKSADNLLSGIRGVAIELHRVKASNLEASLQESLELFSIQLLHQKVTLYLGGLVVWDKRLLYSIVAVSVEYVLLLFQIRNNSHWFQSQ